MTATIAPAFLSLQVFLSPCALTTKPCVCPAHVMPVCVQGRRYQNPCFAHCMGEANFGACGSPLPERMARTDRRGTPERDAVSADAVLGDAGWAIMEELGALRKKRR
jgi:hypothetical protein